MHEKQEENYTEYSKTKFPVKYIRYFWQDSVHWKWKPDSHFFKCTYITYKYNKSITSTQHLSIKMWKKLRNLIKKIKKYLKIPE